MKAVTPPRSRRPDLLFSTLTNDLPHLLEIQCPLPAPTLLSLTHSWPKPFIHPESLLVQLIFPILPSSKRPVKRILHSSIFVIPSKLLDQQLLLERSSFPTFNHDTVLKVHWEPHHREVLHPIIPILVWRTDSLLDLGTVRLAILGFDDPDRPALGNSAQRRDRVSDPKARVPV